MIETTKTANQLYKESGSQLPFSEWIEEQKLKGIFIKNDTLNNIVKSVMDEPSTSSVNKPTQKTFLGLSKPILIVSTLVVVSAVIYKISTLKK